MGKKIVLAVFGGIALLGLLMSIVGWALGGRPGHIRVSNGSMVYRAGSESVEMGQAPWWAEYAQDQTFPMHLFGDQVGYAVGEHHGDHESTQWFASGEEIRIDSEKQQVPLSFSVEDLESVTIDIDAGYLVIKQGDELGFTVQGPLEYSSEFSDGTWNIWSETNLDAIRTQGEGDGTRFYNNGQDVTTVFTIVLPKNAADVYASLDLGVMTAKNLQADTLDLTLDMGSVQVKDSKAKQANFTVDLGAMEVKDVTAAVCELKVNLGNIDFRGDVTESLSANCELGAIQIQMPKPSSYECSTDVNLGSIIVDGNTMGALSSSTFGDSDADDPLEMDLSCDLGSIEVKFD